MKLASLRTHIHRTSLSRLSNDDLAALEPLAMSLIEPDLSALLADGFPLPLSDIYTLVEPSVSIADKRVLLLADIEVDRARLRSMLARHLEELVGSGGAG